MAENEQTVDTGDGQVTIKWDDSKMESSYANVCNVTSTREEMTLLFGTNQIWHAGQRDVTVQLSNRVVINPHAAKRLHNLLGRVLEAYEGRFGELSTGPIIPETVTKG